MRVYLFRCRECGETDQVTEPWDGLRTVELSCSCGGWLTRDYQAESVHIPRGVRESGQAASVRESRPPAPEGPEGLPRVVETSPKGQRASQGSTKATRGEMLRRVHS